MVERADLFQAALERRLETQAPLAARMRPQSLDDMVGQQHLLGAGRPLRALIESDRLSSALLWGPPGTGKTTLARLIAGVTKRAFVGLSAVSAGVKDVRETVDGAKRLLGEQGRGTVLFLDEVHRFNRAQQDALLPSVEAGELTLIGATTENPFFSVNGPLLSRSTLFRLEPLSEQDIVFLLRRALTHEGAAAEEGALAFLAGQVDGDARAALNSLEVAIALAATDGHDTVNQADVEAARSTRALRYGDDEHYDVISAFIKSIRGSDADAGLYWLARMLEAGEDARFIARRLVILASEDVGMAESDISPRSRCGRQGRRVRGASRGAAQPGASRRPSRQRAQVELCDRRAGPGQGRRGRDGGGHRPQTPEGCQLSRRGAAGARQRLRVPP